jgi:inner membrane protein
MDTLTHTAIGICSGHLIAGKQLGKKAMLFGAIANNLPDMDVLANLWAADTKVLLIHRGITHSFLANIILTFVLSWLFQKLYSKYNVNIKKWLLLFGSGLALHLFTDALTSYGTGWFEPFDHTRVTFNTIFILDPLFSIPLWIASLVILFMKQDSPKSFVWSKCGLVISFAYLFFTIVNKVYVNSVVEKNLRSQNMIYTDYLATPTPLNNLLWYIVVKKNKAFEVGYYSVLDKDPSIKFRQFLRNDSLLNFPCDTNSLGDLVRFSKGYYCLRRERDTIIFSDMRFGQIGGWYKPDAAFVFNFKLAAQCYNKDALQKGRFEAFEDKALPMLWKRMLGSKD